MIRKAKGLLLSLSIGLMLLYIFALVNSKLLFPGLRERALTFLIPVVILTIIAYANVRKLSGLFVLLFSLGVLGFFILAFHISLLGFLSYESLAVFFIMAGIIFFEYGIDSRYMILSALLLLWLCPFLLIYKFSAAAEAAAIYAFYFLVIGVALQLADLRKEHKVKLRFESASIVFFSKWNLIVGIVLVIFFGVAALIRLSPWIRVLAVYFGTILVIGYLFKYLDFSEAKK
jgi:hypothetical protein